MFIVLDERPSYSASLKLGLICLKILFLSPLNSTCCPLVFFFAKRSIFQQVWKIALFQIQISITRCFTFRLLREKVLMLRINLRLLFYNPVCFENLLSKHYNFFPTSMIDFSCAYLIIQNRLFTC